MSRPPNPRRTAPSLSLSTPLLARARDFLLAHPGAHASLSALVDVAISDHLDDLEARARFDAARPLSPEAVTFIEIRVDHNGDPAPFQAAARALYPAAERQTIRRAATADVCGNGCDVVGTVGSPSYERVRATERLLDHEGWRRSKVAPPDWLRPAVLVHCANIGAPSPPWL